MKETLFSILLVLACAAPLWSQKVYITPQLELGAGISSFYEDYELNPGLGPGLVLGINIVPRFSLEGDVRFIYWFADEPDHVDITYYEIPFCAGINFHLNDRVGLIFGMGGVYQYYDAEVDLFFTSPHGDSSETNFTFYAGININVDRLVLRPQFVFIDAKRDTYSLQMTLGYKIDL